LCVNPSFEFPSFKLHEVFTCPITRELMNPYNP